MRRVSDDEEAFEERRGGEEDRRTAHGLRNPQLWVAICGLLLTASIFSFSFMYARFSEMLVAQQTMLVSITRQDAEQKALTERIAKLENQISVQQQAYNFNFSTRLAAVEAKTGTKTKEE